MTILNIKMKIRAGGGSFRAGGGSFRAGGGSFRAGGGSFRAAGCSPCYSCLWETLLTTGMLHVNRNKTGEECSTVLCLGQDFWGTPVSPYLNFRGTFANSG